MRVFGVWAPGEPVANLVFHGLYASSTAARNRPARPSPTAAACSCIGRWDDEPGMSQVFDETTLATWQGHLTIGEAPDSTTGGCKNTQPAFKTNAAGEGIAVARTGNLTSTAGGGGRPRHGPPRGSHRDRPPIRDRSRQGAVHDLFYGGLSDPGPGCGGPGRHPPPAATQPSTVPLPNS